MRAEVKPCPCGADNCGKYVVSGIGPFPGPESSMSRDEAIELARRWNAFEIVGNFSALAGGVTWLRVRPVALTIYRSAENHFDLHFGEYVANGLVYDELLGEVARIAGGQLPRYLRHIDAIVNQMEKRAAKRREQQETSP
jgi:hypothetical protein